MLVRLGHARTLGIAAEMAFWLFLSLLPLAAVAGLVVAKFARTDATFASYVFDSLPTATHELVSRELGSMSAWNGGRFGVLAAVAFLWLASSGISSLIEGIELETESRPRTWLARRALALASCLALPVGIALLTLLGAGFGWLLDVIGLRDPFASPGWMAARLVLAAILALGLVSGFYYVAVPREPSRRMPLLPGAALACVIQTLAGLGYRAYLRTLGDGGAYQGGLASIGVTMIGLYFLCIALLIGAELNQVLGERTQQLRHRSGVVRVAAPPPSLDLASRAAR
ncbi:MAG TPA: YihY/virulence factor BrkB family protein [Polyangiaceae bacterium]|nr:YihY/virulence factor BrkB family protein [Polyangiaceae bacterium]